MRLNVKIAYFNVKNVHFIDFNVFHRKNTIKSFSRRRGLFQKTEVILVGTYPNDVSLLVVASRISIFKDTKFSGKSEGIFSGHSIKI